MTKNNLKVEDRQQKTARTKGKKQVFRGSNKPNRSKFWKRLSNEAWPATSTGC